MPLTALATVDTDTFTPEDREAALDASRALSRLSGRGSVHVKADAGESMQSFVLPAAAVHMLTNILVELGNGRDVRVMPTNTALTTQEAADMLNVSRPYLIRLLEEGKVRYHMVGTHRRIRLDDLMAYRHERDARSDEAMNELVREAQELGLGY